MIIYLVTNKINGKQYVGQTTRTLEERWYEHCYDDKSANFSILKSAIKKYGENNFKVEVIRECKTQQELNEFERYFIAKYNTISPNGYNIRAGGDGGGKLHPKTVAKIKKKLIGRKLPLETRRKMSLTRTGQKRGKYNVHYSKEEIERRSNFQKNRRWDEETKRRISESNKKFWAGKNKGPDNPRYGAVLTDEQKENVRKGKLLARLKRMEKLSRKSLPYEYKYEVLSDGYSTKQEFIGSSWSVEYINTKTASGNTTVRIYFESNGKKRSIYTKKELLKTVKELYHIDLEIG